MPSDFNIIDDQPHDPEPAPEDGLNLTRIRAIALDRRAAHRRVLWTRAIVFTFACMTVMTAVNATRGVGSPRYWLAGAAAVFAFLTLRAVHRLSHLPGHPSPERLPRPEPGAFDSLGDGSRSARGLDELRGR